VIILALDSTTPAGSAALGMGPDGTRDIDARAGDPARSWGERLPQDLLRLLDDHGHRPGDVTLFAVATGPGSLTGLRVGIATVQGLAFATGRPVAPVSALDALAEHGGGWLQERATDAADPGDWVIGAWTNAMRGEVFHALYGLRPAPAGGTGDGWVPLIGAAVGRPEAAAASWRDAVASRSLLLVGDIEASLTAPAADLFGSRLVLCARPLLASSVLRIAARRFAAGNAVLPHAVHPLYVRTPDAVLARDRAAAAGVAGPPRRS
jgi:tRNA threonylcarbamoyladenosine biosynthesis protein TsaB